MLMMMMMFFSSTCITDLVRRYSRIFDHVDQVSVLLLFDYSTSGREGLEIVHETLQEYCNL